MLKYLFLLSVAAGSFPAAAQDAGEEIVIADRRAADDRITVTATGLATDSANTGQSVTVIGQNEIERIQGADIARVLNRAPSVAFTRNGPLGSFTGVSVRGAASEQLLVLIDGVRVADQASPSGGFDFGTLLATNVASLDLLRGANSTIWGADALGGVLAISTRGRGGLATSVEYGARDTLTAAASGALEGEGYFVGLNGSALRSDGFSAAAAGSEPDGLRQFGLGGSAFVDVAGSTELFVTARYAEGDLGIDGFPAPAFVLADTLETQRTRQFSGALGFNYYGQDLTLRASYGISDTERENADPVFGPTFASDGRTASVTLRGEYRAIGGLTLAFGGEHRTSRYETSFDARASARIIGGYLQAGWVLGGLAAHLGARVDDHELFGGEVSLGGDISYGLGGGWRAKASVGEGFKTPTLFQLFSDYGNASLQPERSTSYDLGVELGRRGAGTHFALTGFRRDSSDLIGFASCFGSAAPLCATRPFGYYANIARARAQGIEVEAGAQVTEGLRISGLYALIDTADRTSGRDLARRPRHAATLFADYAAPFGLSLGADLRLVGASFDNAANSVRLGGYALVDVRAAFALTDEIELFGRVENVLDADYQTAAGYATAGRGAFVGVRGRM
ncbi:MAG: TonB-dependent receptor [Qipengyuania sp.]|nr:TonB-dependent receptor [Qipengyuania sp.]